MLIISHNRKLFFTTEKLIKIFISPYCGGSWIMTFVFDGDNVYRWNFESETIAQRNFDNIVRAYHEGHREVYLEE